MSPWSRARNPSNSSFLVLLGRFLFLAVLLASFPASLFAYEGLVEKKVFSTGPYTAVCGSTIREVRIGYETYGRLNEDAGNVVLVTHFFAGNSHAAGRYQPQDPSPGYWDGLIGAGKPIDTDRFFVISSDTLVNANVRDGITVTTGPASIDPETGKPYGMSFPVVTIRDFVNVQKALLDSLGIRKIQAVVGASMGAMQAFEWAAAFPDMVDRIIPVVGTAAMDAYGIGMMDLWAAPIRLDPNWNGGNYYGGREPVEGIKQSLRLVNLQAFHPEWAAALGRKWAVPGKDPVVNLENRYAIQATLDEMVSRRATVTDANHLLYLTRAIQLFTVGGKDSLAEGLKPIKAKVLLLPSKNDLLLFPEHSRTARDLLLRQGNRVEFLELEGPSGHMNGIIGLVPQASERIRQFLEN